jgi:hypothetical protein
MIYDIKVFDGQGKLKEVIDGQKRFGEKYGEAVGIIGIRHSSTENTKTFNCPICDKLLENVGMARKSCGSTKCLDKIAYAKRVLPPERKFKCRICETDVITHHRNQVTCLSDACKAENVRRTSREGWAHKNRGTTIGRRNRDAKN